jgi:hypothetical protein
MRFCFAIATLAIIGTTEAGLFRRKNKNYCNTTSCKVTTSCTTCMDQVQTVRAPVQTVAYVAQPQPIAYIKPAAASCTTTCTTASCTPCVAPKPVVLEVPVVQQACSPICNTPACVPCVPAAVQPYNTPSIQTIASAPATPKSQTTVDKRLNSQSGPILVEPNGQVFIGKNAVSA